MPRENVLADVFGITLEGGDAGGTSPAAPSVEDRVAARERAAHLATVRAVAAEEAKAAGIKQQRARSFVSLLDLTGVAADSDGEPDATEIERIVRAGVETYPELQARSIYGRVPGGR